MEALSKTTGAQVGKRQVQELVGRAAQDFDAFYQERQAGALAPSESGSILAISVDGKGVVLRGEDLREATRQRAEASEHKLQKRLSKGESATPSGWRRSRRCTPSRLRCGGRRR